jgi:hypothetical protein
MALWDGVPLTMLSASVDPRPEAELKMHSDSSVV